jgi:hypothetical protein
VAVNFNGGVNQSNIRQIPTCRKQTRIGFHIKIYRLVERPHFSHDMD